jgi:tetratricopeptide (TPR) repeat protein
MQAGTAADSRSADIEDVIAAAETGDHQRASLLARSALDRGEMHPLFLNLRAWWHEQNGRLPAALADLEHAHALAPEDVPVLNALGLCRERLGRTREACEAFDRAAALAPEFPPALMNRGRVLEALGDFDGASASYGAALKLGYNAHAEFAALAARRADWPNARLHAREALAIRPALVTAEHVLASVEIAEGDYGTAKGRLARLLNNASLAAPERATTLSLLGDALDGAGEFHTAFESYEAGNAARREALALSYGTAAGDRMRVHLERLTDYFGKLPPGAFVAPDTDAAGNEHGPQHHVFLLGFARSGTTLLEEALAAHPDVATTQEKDALDEAVAALFLNAQGFDRLMALKGAGLRRYRRSYWQTLAAFGLPAGGACLIDKQPYNTIRLPLLAKLFPAAKILFSLRDPRDVVLSAFRRRFVLSDSNRPLLTLEGAARFYDSVMQLAVIYRSKLPLNLMEARHEDLVDDFGGATRRICSYIGIPWTDELATFAGRHRPVMTPSAVQLREGLSARGVGHWRNYARELAPVLPILAPWVERFGYPAD